MSRRPTDEELRDAAQNLDWWICESCGGLVTTKNTRCYCGDEPGDRIECDGCEHWGEWCCTCGRVLYRCEACGVERREHPHHRWCMRCSECFSSRFWVLVPEKVTDA